MDPERVNSLVEKYLNEEFSKLKTKNSLSAECTHGAKAWVASTNHWNYGKVYAIFT